jgi:hypothetical protein
MLTALGERGGRIAVFGSIAEAARVAAAVIQSTCDLVGVAGFDWQSGPGIGMAVKESGKSVTIKRWFHDEQEA